MSKVFNMNGSTISKKSSLHKKSTIAIIIIVVLLILGVVVVNLGKEPLKKLSTSNVTLIEITALPPNEVKYIDKLEDIETIINKLRKVVVYDKVKQNDYDGQVIIYTLFMRDGSKREFMISNPIVSIDGVYYKTKYAPANELSRLYNNLDYNSIKK